MQSRSSKTWMFTDCRDGFFIKVSVQEIIDADSGYGLYTWPCAVVLSQYLVHQRAYLEGKRVVELGAGTSLAGLVASKCHASVLLTDHAGEGRILENCQDMVSRGRASGDYMNVEVTGLTWGHFSPALLNMADRIDVIIAADCFYNTKDFEPVLSTVAYLFEVNRGAQFWCTYHVRSADRSFEYLFTKWRLKCLLVQLDNFTEHITADCVDRQSWPAQEIQLMIVTAS